MRTEEVEFRAAGHQLQKIGRRQLVAERILGRRVNIGRRTTGGDGTNREGLPCPKAENGIFGDGDLTRLASLHLARFDQVEILDVAVIGAEDGRPGRIEDDLRTL